MSSSVRGTGGRFQALAMTHHVFHRASLGFLEDWAYMSFSRSMISWSSSLVMVLSKARFMLPRPRACTTGRSGLLVTVSDSCMTKMSGPWRHSQILLVDRWSRPCSWNVVRSMALKESMSSIPISATLMARSPMSLARSQSSMSLNPIWLFLNDLMWKRGVVVCVLWVQNLCMYVFLWPWYVCETVILMMYVSDRDYQNNSEETSNSAHLNWSHSWCHGGSCCPGLSLLWMI